MLKYKLYRFIRSFFQKAVGNKRGSPTVEYLMLMACGVLLVSILYAALTSNQVQESVIKKVEEVISGQTQTNDPTMQTPELNSSYQAPNLISGNSTSSHQEPLVQNQLPNQDTSSTIPSQNLWGGMIKGVTSFADTVWDSTKNTASSIGTGMKHIASDIWNWTKNNKEYVAGGATILAGIGALFLSPLLGAGILISAGLGAGTSWLMGSDVKTIAKDAAIGGFAGTISMGIGGALTSGFRAGAAGLLSKMSPFFQRYLPIAFGGGGAGFTDTAIWDKLKNGAVNWKNALLSAAIGTFIVLGVGQLLDNAPSMIAKINQLPVNPFEQYSPVLAFDGGGSPVSKTIGDTGFGQWLQKFTTSGDGSKFSKKVLQTKPKHSPNPEKWIKKGGKITIDKNGVWMYTNKQGQSVSYPDGYPDFSKYVHPKIKPVKINFSTPENRPKDFKAANLKTGLNKNSKPSVPANSRPPDGYTWHHYQDGTTMMLVNSKVHAEFKHAGGISKMKNQGDK